MYTNHFIVKINANYNNKIRVIYRDVAFISNLWYLHSGKYFYVGLRYIILHFALECIEDGTILLALTLYMREMLAEEGYG